MKKLPVTLELRGVRVMVAGDNLPLARQDAVRRVAHDGRRAGAASTRINDPHMHKLAKYPRFMAHFPRVAPVDERLAAQQIADGGRANGGSARNRIKLLKDDKIPNRTGARGR